MFKYYIFYAIYFMHFIIAVDNLFIKLNELKRQYKK